MSGIFQFLIPPRARTHAGTSPVISLHLLSYPPASRGREWNFPIPLPPRARTHAGTSPVISLHLPSYPPASRGREWNFSVPHSSACEDARGYISRNQPVTHQLPYPPASRGREWNFPIPHSSACEDARGYTPALSQRRPTYRTRPRGAESEYGAASGPVPRERFGNGLIVKTSSPPAWSSARVT